MDQSKTYDLVDHPILLLKLKALGLDEHAIKFMDTYLNNRIQSVYIEGKYSYPLHTGCRSVIQGSGLSNIMYLIFILDLPLIHQEQVLSIPLILKSDNPDSVTYIDDNFILVKKQEALSIQDSLNNTILKIETYMSQNMLALNKEKTQLVVLTKNQNLKNTVQIAAEPKNVIHSKSVKILGVEISDTINWRHFLLDSKRSISKQLVTRTNALKLLKKTTPTSTLKILSHGIWMSKLLYGAELWSGAPKYILKHLQHLQLDAARAIIGPIARQWSTTHLLKDMNWLSIQQIAQLSSAKMTHKCLLSGKPEVINHLLVDGMKNKRTTQSNGPFRLGPKPAGVGQSKTSKYQYRANAYQYFSEIPQILREIRKPHLFNKRVKRWLRNNDDLPTNRQYDKDQNDQGLNDQDNQSDQITTTNNQ